PGGGTVQPFNLENLGTESMFFQAFHPQAVESYLADCLAPNLVAVIRKTMAEAGCPGQTPDYLALRHLRPPERSRVLQELNLREQQSDSLADVGHHGPNDVIISLDRGLKRGAIKAGSRVVLAAAGIGFTYGAALIQWGPA
ncbi:MAG: hypothetical protein NTY64_08570, partial [Deltaproteobacteria bacterium]|nr:hypothetical protein [Deltaproteobacteria bacterium]